MKTRKTVTVIDIGSTKVCCCIASISKADFEIIGVGYCACFGVKSGVIIDMDAVEKSVSKSIEKAEKMVNFRVKSAYVSISGKGITSKIVELSLLINGRIVTYEDVAKLLSCGNEHCSEQEDVLHFIPVLYSIDSMGGVKDPVGMIANRLSVKMNLVTVSKSQLNNVLLCLKKCHIDIAGVAYSGYCSGLFAIDEESNSDRQIIIDFGGGVTTISFFYKGIFCGQELIQLGGKNITNDIALGLNVSVTNAERLKTLHGAAFVSITDDSDMLFVPTIEDDVVDVQQVPKSALNQIIQARVEEILLDVKNRIKNSIFSDNFSSEIIITGGGSALTGIKELSETMLNKKIKVKKVKDFFDFGDILIGNDFATSFGMVKFAQFGELPEKRKKNKGLHRESGFFKKILNWIESDL